MPKRHDREAGRAQATLKEQEDGEDYVDRHDGAHAIADWLGGVGWFILIAGLLASLVLGLVIGTSCEESETLNDCDQEIITAWIVGIAGAFESVVVALLFFAGRHVLLLLTEIAER